MADHIQDVLNDLLANHIAMGRSDTVYKAAGDVIADQRRAIAELQAEVERLREALNQAKQQFAVIARGEARGYGITADELHNRVIDALRKHCEHHGLPAGWMDGEAGRPLEQTICMAIQAARDAAEAARGSDERRV